MFIDKKDLKERRQMKQVLEQWSGKFEVDGEIYVSLDNVKVKDGNDFHVRLLPKNREVDDEEDLLSAYRL